MKLIQIMAALLFVVLALAFCGRQSREKGERELQARAEAAVRAHGLTPAESRIVQGVHEPAVCGTASGQHFIFRGDPARTSNALIVQGDMPSQQFEALVKAWCG
ncbi:hypothetical protein SGCZBJ_03850 [Caulobacter zeae]|uniref:Uncharacterized protein n=1 Tax=Caulobacter zeae TaxID=2055137 RepID=A0A2N5DQ16_9CAUL|nr:hypothetical protein SGCZBJ_03850 [Caulobacter zeae]